MYYIFTNFRIEGKATLSKTVTKTIEGQGETEFCWLFSLANVIVSSLWTRVGKFPSQPQLFEAQFSGEITDPDLKREAKKFLNRKDLRQKIRRELCFGLFPKTLRSKF